MRYLEERPLRQQGEKSKAGYRNRVVGSTSSRQESAQEEIGYQAQIRLTARGAMIRKLSTGEYRLYSRKIDPKTQRRRNLGTFKTRAAAEKHEREVQYFKRH